MRATRFGWRWRRNPLRRPTDVLEAWVGVASVTLVMLAGPSAAGRRARSPTARSSRRCGNSTATGTW
ncbi:hypothetical protein ACFQ2B_30250 [Streptomyces stramineus]